MSFYYNLPLIGEFFKFLRAKHHFKNIESCFYYTDEQLKQFQLFKLKELVSHAYENVQLYKEKWDQANVHPSDLRRVEDLSKFPVVTKEDFRKAYPNKLISKGTDPKKCHIVGTSGSTGSPVKLLYDKDKTLYEIASICTKSFSLHLDVDVEVGMSILVQDKDAMDVLSAKEFKKARDLSFDALDAPEKHIEYINRVKPDYIISYPSVLKNIAIKAKNTGAKVYVPKILVTSGESIDVHTRKIISETFPTQILDAYVSTEAGAMAIECQNHNGLHVISYKSIVEIVDENLSVVPHGEKGNVVVTDLTNFATPVIRYSGMGDISSYSTERCSCKMSHLPVLTRIEGRKVDTIVLPDSEVVHPFKLTLAMQDIPAVHKFQIRHEELDQFKILVVKDSSEDNKRYSFDSNCDAYKKIMNKFRKILSEDISIDVELVGDIPRKFGSHKYQTVVSLVNNI